jgi:hypothetical protein
MHAKLLFVSFLVVTARSLSAVDCFEEKSCSVSSSKVESIKGVEYSLICKVNEDLLGKRLMGLSDKKSPDGYVASAGCATWNKSVRADPNDKGVDAGPCGDPGEDSSCPKF